VSNVFLCRLQVSGRARPDLKTVDHVWVMGSGKVAWLGDPDGNVLCVHQTG